MDWLGENSGRYCTSGSWFMELQTLWWVLWFHFHHPMLMPVRMFPNTSPISESTRLFGKGNGGGGMS